MDNILNINILYLKFLEENVCNNFLINIDINIIFLYKNIFILMLICYILKILLINIKLVVIM